MTIDFADKNWKLKRSLSFTRFTSRIPKELGLPLTARLLRVEARFSKARITWKIAGSLSQIHRGSTSAKGHQIAFGQQLVTMADLTPYTLLFRPVAWLPEGYLRVWEYLPPLTDRDLLNLSLQQESSVLSTITQIFTMAQSDTRAALATIAALQTALTNTQQAIVAQFVSVGSNMVQEFRSTLNKADFVQTGSVYIATVSHTLNNSVPQLNLFDNQGDNQGLAQLIVASSTQVKVELSADQWADNAYPMRLVIQGVKGPSSTAPTPPIAVPNTNFAVRYNPGKSGGALEWSDNAGQSYTVAAGASNVKELYLYQGNIFSLDDANTYKVTVPGTWAWSPSDAAAYAVAITGTLIGKRAA